jgi:hypothetical protein
LHVVDGEAFLTDASDEAIHHLNTVGTGLWRLLADDISPEEAADVLHGAFPAIGWDAIARDIAALFTQLAGAGFILPLASVASQTLDSGRRSQALGKDATPAKN